MLVSIIVGHGPVGLKSLLLAAVSHMHLRGTGSIPRQSAINKYASLKDDTLATVIVERSNVLTRIWVLPAVQRDAKC